LATFADEDSLNQASQSLYPGESKKIFYRASAKLIVCLIDFRSAFAAAAVKRCFSRDRYDLAQSLVNLDIT
jgi:hypothetical protein